MKLYLGTFNEDYDFTENTTKALEGKVETMRQTRKESVLDTVYKVAQGESIGNYTCHVAFDDKELYSENIANLVKKGYVVVGAVDTFESDRRNFFIM